MIFPIIISRKRHRWHLWFWVRSWEITQ